MADDQASKLKTLIETSDKVLITSHISPDPDALSSLLLMGQTLRLNFPKMQVQMVLEEKPTDLNFLMGFDSVKYQSVYEFLADFKPDLFILLDGNNYDRSSRHDGVKIRHFIQEKNIKTAIIDHHEDAGRDETDIFINNHSPSTVQDVYSLCFETYGWQAPEQAAQIAMTGFYADTGGFVYVKDGQPGSVFEFAAQLVGQGANIELVKNQLNSFSQNDMKVIGELASNVTHKKDYNYSYLSDEWIKGWYDQGLSQLDLQRPTNTFLNDYIRNIDGRSWGFIVYKNRLQGENYYSVSFRSQAGQPDVSAYAIRLGGGGHKPAAGAKFEANSLDEAIQKVEQAIAPA